MRSNKYGVRGLKSVNSKEGLSTSGFHRCRWRRRVSFTTPPSVVILLLPLQRRETGTRHIETNRAEDGRLLGELRFSEVTRQIAYSIYEKYVVDHGSGSANKAMSACQAAFNYGMLKFGEITSNPFYQLHKLTSSPRCQRWTDQELSTFIKKADEMGHPSVGLCALLCMELVQQPGDILSMKWGANRFGRWASLCRTRYAWLRVIARPSSGLSKSRAHRQQTRDPPLAASANRNQRPIHRSTPRSANPSSSNIRDDVAPSPHEL
jgi:hypothetical protein